MYQPKYNAKLLICPSIFVIDCDSNITISGDGTIDGNRPYDGGVDTINSLNSEPEICAPEYRMEDFTAGCCIAVDSSYQIRIENLKIKSGYMHCLAFNFSEMIYIEQTDVSDAHDKCIVFLNTKFINITNNYIHDALFEDGVIFYAYNRNCKVNSNRIERCARYGISIGVNNYDVLTVNNTIRFCEGNYNCHAYEGVRSIGDHLVGGRIGSHKTASYFERGIALTASGTNHIFSNLRIDYPYNMTTVSFPEAPDWTAIWIHAEHDTTIDTCMNIVFDNCQIINHWARYRGYDNKWGSSPMNPTFPIIQLGTISGGRYYEADSVTFVNCVIDGYGDGMEFICTGHAVYNAIKFINTVWKNGYYGRKFYTGTATEDSLSVRFINY
jgi:hypothetical protein